MPLGTSPSVGSKAAILPSITKSRPSRSIREAGSINRPFSINQVFVSLKMGVPSHVKFQGTGNSDYNNTDDKIAKQEPDGDDLVA
jgi:hypothetical protein